MKNVKRKLLFYFQNETEQLIEGKMIKNIYFVFHLIFHVLFFFRYYSFESFENNT